MTLALLFPLGALRFVLLLVLGKAGLVGDFLRSSLGVDILISSWRVVIAAFVAGLPLIRKLLQAAAHPTNSHGTCPAAATTQPLDSVAVPEASINLLSALTSVALSARVANQPAL